MPVMPPRLRRLKRLPNEQRLQDDRAIRQNEQYYKSRGYADNTVEQMASDDFNLAQQLNRKKRGLRNIKLTGIEN